MPSRYVEQAFSPGLDPATLFQIGCRRLAYIHLFSTGPAAHFEKAFVSVWPLGPAKSFR